MKIVCIGDIVSKPGRNFLKENLVKMKEILEIDFVIANGENSAGGTGITKAIYEELISYGIDVITMGNHTWAKKEIFEFIEGADRLVRPANYPKGTMGNGYRIISYNHCKVGVINLNGRTFMDSIDCPFVKAEEIIDEIRQECEIIVVDFHAEATSEKLAMGYFLDGKVEIVFGTHTHVPTADERILPKGTAFITDVGMTGPSDSILGVTKDLIVNKFLTGLPTRFDIANNKPEFGGLLVKLDEAYRVVSLMRLNESFISQMASDHHD